MSSQYEHQQDINRAVLEAIKCQRQLRNLNLVNNPDAKHLKQLRHDRDAAYLELAWRIMHAIEADYKIKVESRS